MRAIVDPVRRCRAACGNWLARAWLNARNGAGLWEKDTRRMNEQEAGQFGMGEAWHTREGEGCVCRGGGEEVTSLHGADCARENRRTLTSVSGPRACA